MDESDAETHKSLSQSYAQSLQRISNLHYIDEFGPVQQNPEVIEERERTWGKFFEKYEGQGSDHISINLGSPLPNEEEVEDLEEDEEEEEDDFEDSGDAEDVDDEEDVEDEEDDDEEDEEEEEEEEYLPKRCVQMRKSKALVQYWVDTGNPPHQLLDLSTGTDSGSSLSEDDREQPPEEQIEEDCDPPPMPKLYPVIQIPESPPKVPQETSNNSSVDTAAYILSNTNTTNKPDTMVILEGSRISEDPLETPQSLPSRVSSPIPEEPTENPKMDEQICDNNNLNTSHDASAILSRPGESVRSKSLDRSRINSCASGSEDSEVKAAMVNDIKNPGIMITNALLKLTKSTFDECRAVNGLPKESSVNSGESSSQATPKSLTLSKKNHKRKLFAGRNSPMDIIVCSSISQDQIVPKGAKVAVHPALQGTPQPRARGPRPQTRASLNTRRKSKLIVPPRTSGDSKDSSEGPSRGTEKKFLKRLGLVPSPSFNTKSKRKIIGGVAKRKSTRKKVTRRSLENDESDSEEDECSESSSNSSAPEEKTDLLSLCTKKMLSVQLERLSGDILRGLDGKNGDKGVGDDQLVPKADVSSPKSNPVSSRRLKKSPLSPKIELDSQESDISTIIMIHCEKKNEKSSAPSKRAKKSVSESEKLEETVENEKLVPEEKKEEKRTPRERPKKSSRASENPKSSSESKKSVSNDGKLSPRQSRSRKSISDSDKSTEVVENGIENDDDTSSSEKVEKKLSNRAIRLMRSRSAKKRREEEEKKRKSRKVKAKKVRVKRSQDQMDLLDEIDSCTKDSSAKGEESQESEEEEESENENRRSLTIGTMTMVFDSDSCSESSRIKKPRRTINEYRKRGSEQVISFSDDEQSEDFHTKMQRSFEEYERKSKKKSKGAGEMTEDQKRIIDDLTGETAQIFYGDIMDSDEEEIIEGLTAEIKRNGMSNGKKSGSIGKRPPKTTRRSKRLSIVRALSYDEASSKQSEETEESPPKRLKAENGVVRKSGNSANGTIRKSSASKEVESDSNTSSSGSMLLERTKRSSGIKRKADFEENCVQERSPTGAIKSSVKRSQSPIKVTSTLPPVVKSVRQSPVEKSASPIKSPAKKPKSVIKSSNKRLSSSRDESSGVESMDRSITMKKIPQDLEISSKKNSRESSPVVSPTKSINRSRKLISSVLGTKRTSRKRVLSSDDDSSVDFFLEKPTENNNKLINDDSSDIDRTECTKLFHNPFEDSGEEWTTSMNKSYERKRSSKNVVSNLRKKSVMTFRTRDDSESDD